MSEDMHEIEHNPFKEFLNWLLGRKPRVPTVAESRAGWLEKTERELAGAKFDAEYYKSKVEMLEGRKLRLLTEAGTDSCSVSAKPPVNKMSKVWREFEGDGLPDEKLK